MMFRYQILKHCRQRHIMQPIEANFSGGVANSGLKERAPDAEATELPPTLQQALQQMLDQPGAHTVGDLAALTDRLTSEMMLFSALVGVPAKIASEQAPEHSAHADPAQVDLHAEFIRDLEA
jgi:hypothetical protein